VVPQVADLLNLQVDLNRRNLQRAGGHDTSLYAGALTSSSYQAAI
jgi:hypothetical protein